MGAGAETAPGPGQDDRAHAGIGARRTHGILEIEMHPLGPGVEAVGAVEGDGANAIVDIVKNGFVRHRRVSSCAFLLIA
jgi:hypothetical protein